MKTFSDLVRLIEADSRRDFLKKLGMGVSGMASGINPLKGITSKDDDDDYDDYERSDIDDMEGHDLEEWIKDNVLDYTIDQAIGDSKISNSLADKIQKMVSDIVSSGDDISNDLMGIFDRQVEEYMSRGLHFVEVMENPEFLELMTVDMTKAIHNQLDLKQVIAKAAARELKGDKPEDILKDIDDEFEAKLDAEWHKRNNPIGYSKFDTAGGKKDYNYTADSYQTFDSLCERLFKAYDI